jgi:hypothetical protein
MSVCDDLMRLQWSSTSAPCAAVSDDAAAEEAARAVPAPP